MQIDKWLTAASYQETASGRYTAHWYAQWSPMAQNRGHSPEAASAISKRS